MTDLRLGRWQDELADVECNTMITDPPYSERTHACSHRDASKVFAPNGRPDPTKARRDVDYAAWTPADVSEFVTHWSSRVAGWFVVMSDHTLARAWEHHLQEAGRYVFAPLPIVTINGGIRLSGDGPSSWTVWLIVARPRTREAFLWGTLRGAYVMPKEHGKARMGGKPLDLMRAIVRDYSRPGDLICDPCAGAGTTLVAALTEGRRAIGSELDSTMWNVARQRLALGFTPDLFGGVRDDVG